MKRFLLTALGLVALGAAAPASAADLGARPYTKAPAIVAPGVNWTGFYIGAEGGGGWGNNSWTLPLLLNVNVANTDISGATAGGVIGYNWQLPSRIVLASKAISTGPTSRALRRAPRTRR